MQRIKFVFALDGRGTAEEPLPLMANHFNVEEEIDGLTRETIQSNIPFVESFIRRVFILGKLPVDEVADWAGTTGWTKNELRARDKSNWIQGLTCS